MNPTVDRRQFLTAIGGGAATLGLVACGPDGPDGPGTAIFGDQNPTVDQATPVAMAPMAPTAADTGFNDRADSIIPELTRVTDLTPADADEERMSHAPVVPVQAARTDQRIVEFSIDVIEGECEVDPANGVSTTMWGFRIAGEKEGCGVPGPVLRARVGDLARITVNNLAGNTQPHNIDFHAVTGQGGGAEGTTVPPGSSATINCRLLYPGAFMYHCAFGDVPMHIAHGMYGMFIVDPETPLPDVDHEWAIMQSEWYLGEPDAKGMAEFDPDRLVDENPTYVTFNGRTDALVDDNSLTMEVGQRARIYMVNEGLNLNSNFHPIGSHWDVVYPEAATHPVNRVIRGSQSTLVVAGGGTVTELIGQVPSTILLVDHALSRTFYKGCIGKVVITGEENAIISVGDDGLANAVDNEPPPAAAAGDPNTVIIPAGAFDPANAANAYAPAALTVAAGTEVTWVNNDAVFHTVTSGTSNGTVAKADGEFDSKEIQPGESFSFTFDSKGTFNYHCTPHPWMKGAVEVTG